jgi:hypothetical protein
MASEAFTRRAWLTAAGTMAAKVARPAERADALAWSPSDAAAEMAKRTISDAYQESTDWHQRTPRVLS